MQIVVKFFFDWREDLHIANGMQIDTSEIRLGMAAQARYTGTRLGSGWALARTPGAYKGKEDSRCAIAKEGTH